MSKAYQNTHDHNFREVSSHDPNKNTRVKCAFCGCWAKKGVPCYQCHRDVDGKLHKPAEGGSKQRLSTTSATEEDGAKRKSVTEGEQQQQTVSSPDKKSAPAAAAPKRSSVSVPDNANQHKFRETSSYDVKAKERMKCPSCGCWVTKGKTCTVCKRITT